MWFEDLVFLLLSTNIIVQKREGVARGELPEAPIPTAAGNVQTNFS
jgi:hypothetical protein